MSDANSTVPEPATLQNLLACERRITNEQWTLLNEMRLRGELPEWVRTNFPSAGTHAEAEERFKLEKLVNKALSGEFVPRRYDLGHDMDGVFYLCDSNDGNVEFHGPAIDLARKSDLLEQLTAQQLAVVACGLHAYAEKLEVDHA